MLRRAGIVKVAIQYLLRDINHTKFNSRICSHYNTVNLRYKVSLSKVSRLLRCEIARNSKFVNVLRCIVLLDDTLIFSHILLTHPIQYMGEIYQNINIFLQSRDVNLIATQ